MIPAPLGNARFLSLSPMIPYSYGSVVFVPCERERVDIFEPFCISTAYCNLQRSLGRPVSTDYRYSSFRLLADADLYLRITDRPSSRPA